MELSAFLRFLGWETKGGCAGRPLNDEGCSAFRQLLAEYRTLPAAARGGEAKDFIDDILKKQEVSCLTWHDLDNFERALLELLPEAHLRRMAWSLRDEYRGSVGGQRYQAYLDSKPPDEASGNADDLRRDLAELLSELQWVSIQRRSARRLRAQLAWSAWALTLIVFIAVMVYTVSGLWWGHNLVVLPYVLLSGALGATLSALRRIQGIDWKGQGDVLEDIRGKETLAAAPVVGMIGALVLYLVFVAGLLKGALFPDLSAPGMVMLKSFKKFVWKTGPQHSADYALVIVWSFVSGFSERLVPDVIDWLGRSAGEKVGDGATASAEPPKGKPPGGG